MAAEPFRRLIFRFPESAIYVNVAVLKETAQGERRVALVPGLMKLGARLHLQTGAGEAIGLGDADVVLCVQPPALAVVAGMESGAMGSGQNMGVMRRV